MKPPYHLLLLLLMSLFFVASCSDDDDDDSSTASSLRGTLVSSEELARFDNDTIIALLTSLGLSTESAYTVTLHKIVYKTENAKGESIDASGIISIPDNKQGSSPLLAYQHGTIFLDSDAPSNSASSNTVPILASARGLISIVPDYIGYGSSNTEVHPYLIHSASSKDSVDSIRAANHFLSNQGITSNNQLYVAGYSEGGYAAMSLHKAIQEEYGSEFSVTASIPGAGPLDMSTTSYGILAVDQILSAALVGFVFKSYSDVYSLTDLIDRAFQTPYNTVVDTAYDGTQSGETIESSLIPTTANLFDTEFRSNYLGNGETQLKQLMADNTLINWKPNAPVLLYHGEEDATVPYINSQNALGTLTANGATNVTLTNCPASPSNHGNCGATYASFLLNYLISNASNL